MKILALDTTGVHCTATLWADGHVLAHTSEPIGRGHAERLAPMVAEVFDMAETTPRDLSRVGVCTGPGSFTGTRVALSFARAFVLPLNIPLLGISGLHVMAAEADPDQCQMIISIVDVRRGELCYAVYDKGQALTPPQTRSISHAQSDILSYPADLYAGDGAHHLGINPNIKHPSGAVLARLCSKLDPSAYPPDPLYARGPDAKLPGGRTV